MKIAVAGWSLHREFKEKRISLLDFPKVVKNIFGIEAIEMNSPFFASLEENYLKELRGRIDDLGMRLVNIAVDGQNISQKDEAKRTTDLMEVKRWFHIAKVLGSPCFRVNTGSGEEGEDEEEIIKRCIVSYKELATIGEREGIRVLLENHGGLSANPDNVVRIMEEVGSPYLRTCPDTGNFAAEIRYEALKKIAPYIFVAHIKTYEFDSQGLETTVDVKRCVDIFKEAGFDGYFDIEFEGAGDQYAGVKKTINLLRRYI